MALSQVGIFTLFGVQCGSLRMGGPDVVWCDVMLGELGVGQTWCDVMLGAD